MGLQSQTGLSDSLILSLSDLRQGTLIGLWFSTCPLASAAPWRQLEALRPCDWESVIVNFHLFSTLPVLVTLFYLIYYFWGKAGTIYMDFPVLTLYKDMMAAKKLIEISLQRSNNSIMNNLPIKDAMGWMWNLENAKTLICSPSETPYHLISRGKEWWEKEEKISFWWKHKGGSLSSLRFPRKQILKQEYRCKWFI